MVGVVRITWGDAPGWYAEPRWGKEPEENEQMLPTSYRRREILLFSGMNRR